MSAADRAASHPPPALKAPRRDTSGVIVPAALPEPRPAMFRPVVPFGGLTGPARTIIVEPSRPLFPPEPAPERQPSPERQPTPDREPAPDREDEPSRDRFAGRSRG